MKNVSMTVTPYGAMYTPPMAPPPSQYSPPPTQAPAAKPISHKVSFSADFDDETEALVFAAYLLTLQSVEIIKKDNA